MNLQKIEDEALHLPKKERALLIQRLLMSLEAKSLMMAQFRLCPVKML